MDRGTTLAAVRQKYPQYNDMSDDQLASALAAKFPQYADLKAPVPSGEGDKAGGFARPGPQEGLYSEYAKGLSSVTPKTPEGIMGGIFNAGQPKELTPLQEVGNAVLPHLATAPTIMAGGELIPALPAAGRILTSGVLGGAKAQSRGENPAWGFFVDALLSGGAEGLAKFAPYFMKVPRWTRSVGEMSDAVKAGAKTEAAFRPEMDAAIAQMQKSMGKQIPREPFLSVPIVDRANPLTLSEAVAAVKQLRGPQFEIGKQQLVEALNGFERNAGDLFGKAAPAVHVPYRPTGAERMASDVVGSLNTPTLRSIADSAINSPEGQQASFEAGGNAAAGASGMLNKFGLGGILGR